MVNQAHVLVDDGKNILVSGVESNQPRRERADAKPLSTCVDYGICASLEMGRDRLMAINTSFAITSPYDILLRGSENVPIGLYHLHMATAEQLCRLHYSMGSVKAVRAKLRTLCDHGYVQFDAMPTKFTPSPYYYVLDRPGLRYLQQAGLDINEGFRASKEVDKHALFAKHTLELNDIIISAAMLRRFNPTYWLESFIHERELKRKPYKATWQGGSFSLIPDTFLIFRMIVSDGGQRRMPIVIEHDRGSEEQQYFRRRIRAYLTMLRSEGYKELFNVGGITIAFTTSAGPARLGRMREWTWQELQASGESKSVGQLFFFTTLEKPIGPSHLWLEPCCIPSKARRLCPS
jgi:Replication-relaxation